MAEYDLIVRGGTVVDGTGASPRTADVGVRDGRIVEVGRVSGTGVREVDAEGALVAPGWVDVHTHYDGQAVWDSQLAPSSNQGVTTVVFGNCGVGFAPVRPDQHDVLVRLMEGVEDIPGAALHEGLTWEWESFPEYLDALERIPHDIDFAAQVPHGALRVYVMGERAVAGGQATPDDIERMAGLAREGIEAGALGFSTSRTINHRSSDGTHTPSLKATAAELAGIGRGLRAAGTGVVQLVSDFADLEREWPVVMAIAEASGRPVSMTVAETISLTQSGSVTSGFDVLDRITAAREAGLVMSAQVAPRAIGLIMGLSTTLNPFMACPPWREVADLPLHGQVAALRSGPMRERLLASYTGQTNGDKLGGSIISALHRMVRMDDPPDYEQPESATIAAIAAREGRRAHEVALDVMLSDDGRGLLYLPAANYSRWNLENVRRMLTHPYAVPGLSDGGAHVGTICDGGFPTYLLSHWGRRRAQGRLPVEYLVEKHTRATARLVELHDRGVLAPGYRADLNVIDLDNLLLRRPEIHADLPTGGRRFLQRAEGYRHTFVAGTETYRDGEPTGATPGRLVRGSRVGAKS